MSTKDSKPRRKPVRARGESAELNGKDRTETIRQIRGVLGRTQSELAAALGVSAKAVQSYEQGWRQVPARVMIQLLVLLALYRKQTMDDVPCWEIRKCEPAERERCVSFTVGRGQFCWLVAANTCRPPVPADELKTLILPCMACPVAKRLLSGWTPLSGSSGPARAPSRPR